MGEAKRNPSLPLKKLDITLVWDRKRMGKKYFRIVTLVCVNGAVLLVMLVAAEIAYRVYRDGFANAVAGITHYSDEVPFSNLGTSNWVIFDEELGYRLNPEKDDFNNFSIRHGEITIPKPEEVYRIIYLGDSIPWDRGGFVERTRDSLKKKVNSM